MQEKKKLEEIMEENNRKIMEAQAKLVGILDCKTIAWFTTNTHPCVCTVMLKHNLPKTFHLSIYLLWFGATRVLLNAAIRYEFEQHKKTILVIDSVHW